MQKHNSGAPDEVRNVLSDLIGELWGAFEAEGWAVPKAEAEFLAGRLRSYADMLEALDLTGEQKQVKGIHNAPTKDLMREAEHIEVTHGDPK